MPEPSDNLAAQQGSRTAGLVAVSRARHLLRHAPPPIFNDPYAIHFVGRRWQQILRSFFLDALFAKVLMRRLMPMTTQHIVRARFAEDCLQAAIDQGVTQYVILGAGFDTYALRQQERNVRVFEIDLAATIALKKERLAAADLSPPENLHCIPFDFERDDLREKLTAEGFDPAQKSFFNWMGVTYYLTAEAIRETLHQLAGIASAGSEVACDYLVPVACVPAEHQALFARMTAFVAKMGEPMISSFDPAQIDAALNLHDAWEIVRNDSPADQQRTYLSGRRDIDPVPPLMWCLALRRSTPAQ